MQKTITLASDLGGPFTEPLSKANIALNEPTIAGDNKPANIPPPLNLAPRLIKFLRRFH